MALTITEEFRAALTGDGRIMCFKITQDETTSTITAASLDLTYIKWFIAGNHYFASDAANTSTLLLHQTVSINADKTQLTIGLPMKANSTFRLMCIGW